MLFFIAAVGFSLIGLLVWSGIRLAGQISKGSPPNLATIIGITTGLFGLTILTNLVITVFTGLSHSTCFQRQGRVLSVIVFIVLTVWPLIWLLIYRQYKLARERRGLDRLSTPPDFRKIKVMAWLAGSACLLTILISTGKLSLWPPVMFAVRNGSYSLVSNFMSAGFSSQASDLCGHVPLPYASLIKNESMLKLLIDRGAPIDSADEQKMTALGYAVMYGQQEVVKYLINNGASMDGTKDGPHPLALAVGPGAEMVKLLLDHGARVNTLSAHGTALTEAARTNRPDVVSLLFQYGAEPNVRTASNQTPLMVAAGGGYQEVVVILLKNGANPFLKDYHGLTAISLAKERGQQTTATLIENYLPRVNSPYKSRALAESIMDGDLDLIKLLLTTGVDLNERELMFGKPALHLALGRLRKEISGFLIENGADVNARDKYGRTPLMEAGALGDLDLVKLLLSKGADPAAKDGKQQTASSLAARQGHREVVQLLESYIIQ